MNRRYLKRGVSDSGKVANDVELEQIAHEEGVRENQRLRQYTVELVKSCFFEPLRESFSVTDVRTISLRARTRLVQRS